MGLLLAIVAFFCGVALLVNLDTGDLSDKDVTGAALICLAVAFLAGASLPAWPWNKP